MDSVVTPMPTEETTKPFAAGMYNHQPLNKTRVAIAVLAGVAVLLLLSTIYFAAQYINLSNSKTSSISSSSSSNSNSSSVTTSSQSSTQTTTSSTADADCSGVYFKSEFANLRFEYDKCNYDINETQDAGSIAGMATYSINVVSKENGDVLNLLALNATSGTVSGNSAIACNDGNYNVVKQGTQYNSTEGTNNGTASFRHYFNNGLLELRYTNPSHVYQYVFAHNYQEVSNIDYYNDDTGQTQNIGYGYCLMSSHPIYIVKSVDGGTSGLELDQNDIYYIVKPTASGNISIVSLKEFARIAGSLTLSLHN